jgi:dTDP-4-dehydrorhamnose reductase
MAKRAWITGAGGLIGNYLVRMVGQFAPGFDVVGLTRDQLDLTDASSVRRLFREQQPDLIIHCAAMSKSPACQANPKAARQTNVEATQLLAELACDVQLIFFSTDLIFDGRKGAYVETDEPNPLSVYAETKVEAEKFVLSNPRHTVVRTSLNAGKSNSGDRSFTEEIRNAWRSGKTLKLFIDEYRSPIPAVITARTVWELANINRSGIFHLAGSERLSRCEIGQLLAPLWPELDAKIEPSSLREYEGAPRPPDTSLNCEKLQKLLSFPLPKFSDWIKANAGQIR